MRFKDFIKEDLDGLFGKVKTMIPGRPEDIATKKFFKPPNPTAKGKSSIKSMTDGGKAIASAPMPSMNLPSSKIQHTLKKPSDKPEFFRATKTSQVQPPLGL